MPLCKYQIPMPSLHRKKGGIAGLRSSRSNKGSHPTEVKERSILLKFNHFKLVGHTPSMFTLKCQHSKQWEFHWGKTHTTPSCEVDWPVSDSLLDVSLSDSLLTCTTTPGDTFPSLITPMVSCTFLSMVRSSLARSNLSSYDRRVIEDLELK